MSNTMISGGPGGKENSSLSMDAFSRLRTSTPKTLFDSKQINDNQPLAWDDQETSGGGTSSAYNQAGAKTTLGVSLNTAGTRVRQTKRRFNYQSGKSHNIMMTGCFVEAKTGVTKRIGYFDANDGIFFQLSGSTFSVVKRKAGQDTVINQSSFSEDKLDGTGPSGLSIDITKAQIFFIDFQWLGVGFIRMGISNHVGFIPCHIFYHANVQSTVSISSPNLPLRYEISNAGSGAATTLDCICSTVSSEAGSESVGNTFSVDRGVTGFTTNNNTNLYPLLSMRLRSGFLGAEIDVDSLSIMCTSASNFRWGLYLNPTIGATDSVSWVGISGSAIEYDTARSVTNVVSLGTLIYSGYVANNTDMVDAIGSLSSHLKLGSTIAGTSDQYVLAVQNLAAGANTYFAAITYHESV